MRHGAGGGLRRHLAFARGEHLDHAAAFGWNRLPIVAVVLIQDGALTGAVLHCRENAGGGEPDLNRIIRRSRSLVFDKTPGLCFFRPLRKERWH